MKVRELIQLLQTCLPDQRVIIHGYEGGYHDVGRIETRDIQLNKNSEWYYGPHDDAEEGSGEERAYLITR